MNIFTGPRKRKTIGTIPVTLNLKEGKMKVREFLDKDSLRVGPRQEERMELKPFDEMTVRELKEELKQRSSDSRREIYKIYLKRLRENDIGTEKIKPPEPEWKRWRKWPDEKPVECSKVEYTTFERQTNPFKSVFCSCLKYPFQRVDGSGGDSNTIHRWRYLTEPLTWKNVERDGEPSEAGWYEISPNGPYRRFRYWCGSDWTFYMGGGVDRYVTVYCPIAPAPEFEEES